MARAHSEAKPAAPPVTAIGVSTVASSATRPARRTAGAIARDYFILTKPSIMLLLLITTVPAMVLAEGGWPDTWLVLATLVGGVLAAGGAGAVNMYLDRDIDELMRRTRSRPIPGGRVPARHALVFGCAMGLGSGVWLYATVNPLSAALAVAAFLFYTTVYTAYLKRTTVHNTVIGGAAGAAPPLIGWTAVTGDLGLDGLLLFLLVFYWQPPHFWALALGLAEDYRAAGVPMMPVVWGAHETKRQILFYSVMTAALSLIFGVVAGLGLLYLVVAALGGAGFVWFAARIYMGEGVEGTRAMFRYSTSYLAVLFAAIVLDVLLLG